MYLRREIGRRLLEVQAVKEDYNLDEQAQRIGLITGISNEIYYCSISYLSTVYLEYILITLGLHGVRVIFLN